MSKNSIPGLEDLIVYMDSEPHMTQVLNSTNQDAALPAPPNLLRDSSDIDMSFYRLMHVMLTYGNLKF